LCVLCIANRLGGNVLNIRDIFDGNAIVREVIPAEASLFVEDLLDANVVIAEDTLGGCKQDAITGSTPALAARHALAFKQVVRFQPREAPGEVLALQAGDGGETRHAGEGSPVLIGM